MHELNRSHQLLYDNKKKILFIGLSHDDIKLKDDKKTKELSKNQPQISWRDPLVNLGYYEEVLMVKRS